jgi:hypothetical protein
MAVFLAALDVVSINDNHRNCYANKSRLLSQLPYQQYQDTFTPRQVLRGSDQHIFLVLRVPPLFGPSSLIYLEGSLF